MKVFEAIANVLKREGVQYLFCYPSTPMTEACAAVGIRPVLCRQERVGVGMADGYARITNGKPFGVVAVQSGPGAENAFSGLATAFSDSTPLLMLARGEPLDRAGIARTFSPTRAFGQITKHSEILTSPAVVPGGIRRALTAFRTVAPGPVSLEIPDNVGRSEIDPVLLEYKDIQWTRSAGDPADIDNAARLLVEARFPVIFAGQGVRLADASAELTELAECLGAPVLTSLLGKGVFNEMHPLSAGVAAGNVGQGTFPYCFERADVIFGIGSSLKYQPLAGAALPEGKTLIHATSRASDFNLDYSIDQCILGDAKLVLRQLTEAVQERIAGKERRPRQETEQDLKNVRDAWLSEWQAKLSSDDVPVNPYRVISEMTKAFDPESVILTHDSGGPRNQIIPFYRTAVNNYIGFGRSHALGSSLGLIMGAKLAAPEKLCVAWLGDAAFGMVGTDFETAVRAGIPVVLVLSNNFEMAAEKDKMLLSHELYETRKLIGNYADMATAMGGYGERVEKPSEIAGALKRAQRINEEGRPVLLEVLTSAETSYSRF
jgi:acetolactate synthase I/II/III large subunit